MSRAARATFTALFGIAFAMTAFAGGRAYTDAEIKAAETERDTKVRALREQEMAQLRIVLGRRAPANRRADLYFRLAELYLEAYRQEFLLEGRVHEKRLSAGTEDAFIDRAHSKPILGKGIQACRDLIALGVPFEKMDQVYYFLGFYTAELGQQEESLRWYDQLVHKFPSSPLASEAYHEMGNAAYSKGQFRSAIDDYRLAVKDNKTDAAARMLHKLAWSYYRVKQYEDAVRTMKEAVQLSVKGGEKLLNLREEALRDMAVFMTEAGKAEEAIAYFQGVVGDKAFYPRVLEKLGKQYERNVEPDKAVMVYESLLKTHPNDDATFRVRVKLFDLDLRRGRYKEALERLQGVGVPGTDDSETRTAAQNLRAMVRRTATEHHEAFRKRGEARELEIAEAYYATYVATFLSKDDPRHETPEIEMYLAEVKRDLGKAKEASELYKKVVRSGDKRYAKEAGALWTASLAEAIAKAPGDPKAKSEPSAVEREFVEAADELQESLGETAEAREAALKAAQVLAGYKSSLADAMKRVRKIIARWPSAPQAQVAARLWLQTYGDQLQSMGGSGGADVTDDLRDAMEKVQANAALMQADQQAGGKLRFMLSDLDYRLKIMAISHQERDKNFGGAGKGYEAFATESQKQEIAEKAYANALGAYHKAGDWEAVDRVLAAWLRRFPKSKKMDEPVRGISTSVLIQGRFEVAAGFFERMGRSGSDPDSLETAGRLYEGLGDAARAQKAWLAYLEIYKISSGAPRVSLFLARSFESAKRDSEATKTFRVCVAMGGELEAECGARLADLVRRSGNLAEAKALYRKVAALSAGKKSAPLSPYVGYAHYQLADLLLKEEKETKLEPFPNGEEKTKEERDAKFKKALGARLDFFETLSKACASTMDAGGPWGVAALDLQASWAHSFADEIEGIPPLKGVDPARAEADRKTLVSLSESLRKKALAIWTDAYARAVEAELLSPALPLLADHLADVGAPAPARAQGSRPKLFLTGLPSDGGPEGGAAAMEKVRDQLTRNALNAQAWADYGNLLWGEGKPLLALIAYDRALAIDRKNPVALNNRGVVLAGAEPEDWRKAFEASALFGESIRLDARGLPAKRNRAALLNYYRIFAKSKPLWDQVAAAGAAPDVLDGLAIAQIGISGYGAAGVEAGFKKAGEGGASASRFALVYHEAAKAAAGGAAGGTSCLDRLKDMDSGSVVGFEKDAVERLRRRCTEWKEQK